MFAPKCGCPNSWRGWGKHEQNQVGWKMMQGLRELLGGWEDRSEWQKHVIWQKDFVDVIKVSDNKIGRLSWVKWWAQCNHIRPYKRRTFCSRSQRAVTEGEVRVKVWEEFHPGLRGGVGEVLHGNHEKECRQPLGIKTCLIHILAIVNNAAMNVGVSISFKLVFLFSSGR